MITITGMDTDTDMDMVAVLEDTDITEKLRVMVIMVGFINGKVLAYIPSIIRSSSRRTPS